MGKPFAAAFLELVWANGYKAHPVAGAEREITVSNVY
jgi:hypothetical protein